MGKGVKKILSFFEKGKKRREREKKPSSISFY